MTPLALPQSILRLSSSFALTLLVNATIIVPANAQLPAPQPTPHFLPDGLTLQVDGWSRLESRQNSDFSAPNSNDPDANLSRWRLGLAWHNPHQATHKDMVQSVFVQPQFSDRRDTHGRRDNGTTDTLALHQVYGDIQWGGLQWRLGRQEFTYGDARLIGGGNWTYMGRSFDAVRVSKVTPSRTTDLFAGRLGQVANKTTSPIFDGIYSTRTRSKTQSLDTYLLYKGDNSGGQALHLWTVGTRPRFTFKHHYDGTIEGAYQFGRTGARDIAAWAYAANIGYTLPGQANWRLAVERDFASGGNPTGTGTYHTFDQLFPTNHWLYGTIDYVGWRNMQDWRLSLKGHPAKKWTLLLDGHVVSLADAHDFWYSDNGKPFKGANGESLRDPSGAASRALDTELDLALSYLYNHNLSLSGGFSRFQPGAFVRTVNGGRPEPGSWLYAQTNYNF